MMHLIFAPPIKFANQCSFAPSQACVSRLKRPNLPNKFSSLRRLKPRFLADLRCFIRLPTRNFGKIAADAVFRDDKIVIAEQNRPMRMAHPTSLDAVLRPSLAAQPIKQSNLQALFRI